MHMRSMYWTSRYIVDMTQQKEPSMRKTFTALGDDIVVPEPNEETRRTLGLIPDDTPGFTDADELVAFLNGEGE